MALNFLILHLVPLARVVQGNALGNCSDPSIHAWGVFPVFPSSRSLLTSYSSQFGPSLGIVLHTLNLTQGYDQLLQYNLEHSWRAMQIRAPEEMSSVITAAQVTVSSPSSSLFPSCPCRCCPFYQQVSTLESFHQGAQPGTDSHANELTAFCSCHRVVLLGFLWKPKRDNKRAM